MKKNFKTDGLRLPMTRGDFFHWMARHGALHVGARPQDYQESENIAWKAYKRGRDDQKKIAR